MEDRKNKLLKLIVESHINTAEPVGSSFLVERAGLDVSAPTVRNEMRELEEEGFLTHPHTSAGRIPTELGYQYYVEKLMETVETKTKIKIEMENIFKEAQEKNKALKDASRKISELVNNAVIVAFSADNIYYTGISNLFSQPEFRDFVNLTKVSSIFDHCEDTIDDLFETVDNGVSILIGQKNPFGNACGLVATKIDKGNLLAVVGPMRMPYAQSVGLLNYLKQILV